MVAWQIGLYDIPQGLLLDYLFIHNVTALQLIPQNETLFYKVTNEFHGIL